MAAETTEPQRVLTEEILADARRQAERILARARRDAQDTTGKAKEAAEKDRAERLAAARAEAARRAQLVLATLPVETGRMRAAHVEKQLEAVHDAVRRRLGGREGFDYRQAVTGLAVEAASRLASDAVVLKLSEADRQAFGAELAEEVRRGVGRDGLQVTVAPEGAAIEGGVIVSDAAGRLAWDNSLAGRLDRLWPALRREIAARTSLVPADPAGPKASAAPKEP